MDSCVFVRFVADIVAFRSAKVAFLIRRGCDFLHAVFVVPPLGGIEAATKPRVPIKTGTTNSAIN